MVDLPPEVEQKLSDMTDAEFSALSARVRAPDSVEALRTAAAGALSGDQLNTFIQHADVSKFVDSGGVIDQAKVDAFLGSVFGAAPAAGGRANYGQSSGGQAPGLRPGDGGRAAAAARFGLPADPEVAAATAGIRPGARGRAEAARRHPQKETRK
jgi:hypothetical protein